ncbi:hypothetical protein Lesp02_84830 [Lentzea sp. NBRC 105346]|uniref:2-oxo acid dehydrogenase subunit E2 n=1 Tax=Lentzea sp. NBRC 105346 TaxID=3032205 RepID=UPI0024A16D25|nr:2-oxo acid dehydrogenase subunit E2 [Lentzea sp. NBRC 105346]GLZ36296.1 hypothetical protein Lesp02_84830 [Lentzea sp. NBRC 105346]
MTAPRVVEGLNRALHRLFAERPDLHLLGEDVLDPYGGAFKVTKGLSSVFPDRVLTTPLSEAGIAGVASGLALAGDQVVVEAMFGDFAALMFDQILNMASKSVTMYGQRKPMRLLVRCPVGGGRGYGPTHSQSVQKHFLGIPNLSLFEATPFHDPFSLMARALDSGPSMLFEDKVLYTRRFITDGFQWLGDWAHVPASSDTVVICPGGVAHRALSSGAHVLVPSRLYPLDLTPVLPLLSGKRVVVAEESTAGGTWGADVAAVVHEELWGSLPAPVRRLSSADSIIPSARHLEDRVILGASHIAAAVTPPSPASSGVDITAPKLNNNDTTYLVLTWLVPDGAAVSEGDPVVELETSKAIEEICAPASGVLRQHVAQGVEVEVGALLATLSGSAPVASAEVPRASRVHRLDKAQQGTAAVVSRAHREVPAAFTAVEVRVDALLDVLRALSDETGAEVGLPEAVVKAVASAHADFGHLFGTLVDDTTVALVDSPHVAVTLDAGNGLFTPVIRDCTDRSIVDISDDLMDFRMKAFRGSFAAAELAGASITVSLNVDPDVVFVQPIVMWPQLCMLSVGGVRAQLALVDDAVVSTSVVTLGLAYDHRVVNGAAAVAFLRFVADSLRKPEKLVGP